MTEVMGSEMKSVIRPLPKYSPDYKPGAAPPHTEIVLYEDNAKSAAGQRSQMLRYSFFFLIAVSQTIYKPNYKKAKKNKTKTLHGSL